MMEVLGWHFLPADRRLRYQPHHPVVLGQPLTLPEGVTPEMCTTGFHASEHALDALNYAPSVAGLVLCRVRLSGVILRGDDKVVASERTVLGWCEADPILHEFACWNAEAALFGASHRIAPDPCSVRALQVKRAWLWGEATNAELSAARNAARAAAGAAARDAARDAAWDAAWAAARDAARAAANTKLEAMALDAMGELRP